MNFTLMDFGMVTVLGFIALGLAFHVQRCNDCQQHYIPDDGPFMLGLISSIVVDLIWWMIRFTGTGPNSTIITTTAVLAAIWIIMAIVFFNHWEFSYRRRVYRDLTPLLDLAWLLIVVVLFAGITGLIGTAFNIHI